MEQLNESGLSWVWRHVSEHDAGFITAFRAAEECGKGRAYTRRENMQRNRSLLSKLQNKGYGVTSVLGTYIENYGSPDEIEVKENSFFVVDLTDRGDLERSLRKLGEEFEQDSIMFIERGGYGSLIGTNRCPNGYPGYNSVNSLGKFKLGKRGEFMTRVNGRPIIFEDVIHEYINPTGFFGRYGLKTTAEKNWRDIELTEEMVEDMERDGF